MGEELFDLKYPLFCDKYTTIFIYPQKKSSSNLCYFVVKKIY